MNGTKENAVKITKTVSCHYSKRIEQEKIANKTVKEKKLVSGKDQLLTATFLVTIKKESKAYDTIKVCLFLL